MHYDLRRLSKIFLWKWKKWPDSMSYLQPWIKQMNSWMMEHYDAGRFDNAEGSYQSAKWLITFPWRSVHVWVSGKVYREKEDVKHDKSPLLYLWFVCQQLFERKLCYSTCPLIKHYSPHDLYRMNLREYDCNQNYYRQLDLRISRYFFQFEENM